MDKFPVWSGLDANGIGRCGVVDHDRVEEFVKKCYRDGWWKLTIVVDDLEIGGIGFGPRTWWIEGGRS